MSEKQQDFILMLENVRMAFPDIYTAKARNPQDKPAFSASFLLPPTHPAILQIQGAITAAANAKWPTEAAVILPALIAGDKVCLHNGDAKAQYEGYAGNMYISTRSYNRPTLLKADATPAAEADGVFYSGCFVNAQVAIWAMQNVHGKRINAQLRGIQFRADGEPFSGGSVASPEDFSPVDGSADGEPPVAPANEWGAVPPVDPSLAGLI